MEQNNDANSDVHMELQELGDMEESKTNRSSGYKVTPKEEPVDAQSFDDHDFALDTDENALVSKPTVTPPQKPINEIMQGNLDIYVEYDGYSQYFDDEEIDPVVVTVIVTPVKETTDGQKDVKESKTDIKDNNILAAENHDEEMPMLETKDKKNEDKEEIDQVEEEEKIALLNEKKLRITEIRIEGNKYLNKLMIAQPASIEKKAISQEEQIINNSGNLKPTKKMKLIRCTYKIAYPFKSFIECFMPNSAGFKKLQKDLKLPKFIKITDSDILRKLKMLNTKSKSIKEKSEIATPDDPNIEIKKIIQWHIQNSIQLELGANVYQKKYQSDLTQTFDYLLDALGNLMKNSTQKAEVLLLAEMNHQNQNMMFTVFDGENKVSDSKKQEWIKKIASLFESQEIMPGGVGKNMCYHELRMIERGIAIIPDDSKKGFSILMKAAGGLMNFLSKGDPSTLIDSLKEGATHLVKKGMTEMKGETYRIVYHLDALKRWIVLNKFKMSKILIDKLQNIDRPVSEKININDQNDSNDKMGVILPTIKYQMKLFQKEVLKNSKYWDIGYHWVKMLAEIIIDDRILIDESILKAVVSLVKPEYRDTLTIEKFIKEQTPWLEKFSMELYIINPHLIGKIEGLSEEETELIREKFKELIKEGINKDLQQFLYFGESENYDSDLIVDKNLDLFHGFKSYAGFGEERENTWIGQIKNQVPEILEDIIENRSVIEGIAKRTDSLLGFDIVAKLVNDVVSSALIKMQKDISKKFHSIKIRASGAYFEQTLNKIETLIFQIQYKADFSESYDAKATLDSISWFNQELTREIDQLNKQDSELNGFMVEAYQSTNKLNELLSKVFGSLVQNSTGQDIDSSNSYASQLVGNLTDINSTGLINNEDIGIGSYSFSSISKQEFNGIVIFIVANSDSYFKSQFESISTILKGSKIQNDQQDLDVIFPVKFSGDMETVLSDSLQGKVVSIESNQTKDPSVKEFKENSDILRNLIGIFENLLKFIVNKVILQVCEAYSVLEKEAKKIQEDNKQSLPDKRSMYYAFCETVHSIRNEYFIIYSLLMEKLEAINNEIKQLLDKIESYHKYFAAINTGGDDRSDPDWIKHILKKFNSISFANENLIKEFKDIVHQRVDLILKDLIDSKEIFSRGHRISFMYYIHANSSVKILKKRNYVIDESSKKWPSEIKKLLPEGSISSMNRENAISYHGSLVSNLFKELKKYTGDKIKQMSELFKEDYVFADEWFKILTLKDAQKIQYLYENVNYLKQDCNWTNMYSRIDNVGFTQDFQHYCLKLEKSPKIDIPIYDDFIKPAQENMQMPIKNTSREINNFRLLTNDSIKKTFKVWSETYKKTHETFSSLKCLTNLMHGELNEDTFSSYLHTYNALEGNKENEDGTEKNENGTKKNEGNKKNENGTKKNENGTKKNSSYIKFEDGFKLENSVSRKIYFSLVQQNFLSIKNTSDSDKNKDAEIYGKQREGANGSKELCQAELAEVKQVLKGALKKLDQVNDIETSVMTQTGNPTDSVKSVCKAYITVLGIKDPQVKEEADYFDAAKRHVFNDLDKHKKTLSGFDEEKISSLGESFFIGDTPKKGEIISVLKDIIKDKNFDKWQLKAINPSVDAFGSFLRDLVRVFDQLVIINGKIKASVEREIYSYYYEKIDNFIKRLKQKFFNNKKSRLANLKVNFNGSLIAQGRQAQSKEEKILESVEIEELKAIIDLIVNICRDEEFKSEFTEKSAISAQMNKKELTTEKKVYGLFALFFTKILCEELYPDIKKTLESACAKPIKKNAFSNIKYEEGVIGDLLSGHILEAMTKELNGRAILTKSKYGTNNELVYLLNFSDKGYNFFWEKITDVKDFITMAFENATNDIYSVYLSNLPDVRNITTDEENFLKGYKKQYNLLYKSEEALNQIGETLLAHLGKYWDNDLFKDLKLKGKLLNTSHLEIDGNPLQLTKIITDEIKKDDIVEFLSDTRNVVRGLTLNQKNNEQKNCLTQCLEKKNNNKSITFATKEELMKVFKIQEDGPGLKFTKLYETLITEFTSVKHNENEYAILYQKIMRIMRDEYTKEELLPYLEATEMDDFMYKIALKYLESDEASKDDQSQNINSIIEPVQKETKNPIPKRTDNPQLEKERKDKKETDFAKIIYGNLKDDIEKVSKVCYDLVIKMHANSNAYEYLTLTTNVMFENIHKMRKEYEQRINCFRDFYQIGSLMDTTSRKFSSLRDHVVIQVERITSSTEFFENLLSQNSDKLAKFTDKLQKSDIYSSMTDFKKQIMFEAQTSLTEIYEVASKKVKVVKDFAVEKIQEAEGIIKKFQNVDSEMKSDFLTILAEFFQDNCWRIRERVIFSAQMMKNQLEYISPSIQKDVVELLVIRKSKEQNEHVKLTINDEKFAAEMMYILKENFNRVEDTIYMQFKAKLEQLDNLENKARYEPDLEVKKLLILTIEEERKKLDGFLTNIKDVGAKLDIVISFQSVISAQLSRIEGKIDQLSSDLKGLKDDIKKLQNSLTTDSLGSYALKVEKLNQWMHSREDGKKNMMSLYPNIKGVNFIESKNILDKITVKFNNASPEGVVLYGIAGVGKSVLASQYVNKQVDKYHRVFWFNCESTESLTNSLKQYKVNESGADVLSIIQAMLKKCELCTSSKSDLVVLDNVNDPTPIDNNQDDITHKLVKAIRGEHIKPLKKYDGFKYDGYYIITTRMDESDNQEKDEEEDIQEIPIYGFDRFQCIDYLTKSLDSTITFQKDIKSLTDALIKKKIGYEEKKLAEMIRPLTLRHIVHVQDSRGQDIKFQIDNIKNSTNDFDYNILIDSISRINKRPEGSQEHFGVFLICSFQPIDDINPEFLILYGESIRLSFEQIKQMLDTCMRAGLLDAQGLSFRMHREVKKVVRQTFLRNIDTFIEKGLEAMRSKVLYETYIANPLFSMDVVRYVEGYGISGSSIRDLTDSFLKNPKKTVLQITADSGYGKTTWMHKLRKNLLEYSIEKLGKEVYFPIWIDLPKIDKIEKKLGANIAEDFPSDENFNIVDEQMMEHGFESDHIDVIKKNYKCLFLIDGYDEVRVHDEKKNFVPYVGNPYKDLKAKEWLHCKIIVCTRTQHIGYLSKQADKLDKIQLSMDGSVVDLNKLYHTDVKDCFNEIRGIDDGVTSTKLYEKLQEAGIIDKTENLAIEFQDTLKTIKFSPGNYEIKEENDLLEYALNNDYIITIFAANYKTKDKTTTESQTEDNDFKQIITIGIYKDSETVDSAKEIIEKKYLDFKYKNLDCTFEFNHTARSQQIKKLIAFPELEDIDCNAIYNMLKKKGLKDPTTRKSLIKTIGKPISILKGCEHDKGESDFSHVHIEGMDNNKKKQYIINFILSKSPNLSEEKQEKKYNQIYEHYLYQFWQYLDCPQILRIVLDNIDELKRLRKSSGQLTEYDLFGISIADYYKRQIKKYPNEKVLKDNFGTNDHLSIVTMYQRYCIDFVKIIEKIEANNVGIETKEGKIRVTNTQETEVFESGFVDKEDDNDRIKIFDQRNHLIRQGIPVQFTGTSISFLHFDYEKVYRMYPKQLKRLKNFMNKKKMIDESSEFDLFNVLDDGDKKQSTMFKDNINLKKDKGDIKEKLDEIVWPHFLEDRVASGADIYQSLKGQEGDLMIVLCCNADIFVCKFDVEKREVIVDNKSYQLRRKDIGHRNGLMAHNLFTQRDIYLDEKDDEIELKYISIDKLMVDTGIEPKNVITPDNWLTNFGVDAGNYRGQIDADIIEVLNRKCPFSDFNYPKRVSQTHTLIYIPSRVNGKLLTMKALIDMKTKKDDVNKQDIIGFGLEKTDTDNVDIWDLPLVNLLGIKIDDLEKQKPLITDLEKQKKLITDDKFKEELYEYVWVLLYTDYKGVAKGTNMTVGYESPTKLRKICPELLKTRQDFVDLVNHMAGDLDYKVCSVGVAAIVSLFSHISKVGSTKLFEDEKIITSERLKDDSFVCFGFSEAYNKYIIDSKVDFKNDVTLSFGQMRVFDGKEKIKKDKSLEIVKKFEGVYKNPPQDLKLTFPVDFKRKKTEDAKLAGKHLLLQVIKIKDTSRILNIEKFNLYNYILGQDMSEIQLYASIIVNGHRRRNGLKSYDPLADKFYNRKCKVLLEKTSFPESPDEKDKFFEYAIHDSKNITKRLINILNSRYFPQTKPEYDGYHNRNAAKHSNRNLLVHELHRKDCAEFIEDDKGKNLTIKESQELYFLRECKNGFYKIKNLQAYYNVNFTAQQMEVILLEIMDSLTTLTHHVNPIGFTTYKDAEGNFPHNHTYLLEALVATSNCIHWGMCIAPNRVFEVNRFFDKKDTFQHLDKLAYYYEYWLPSRKIRYRPTKIFIEQYKNLSQLDKEAVYDNEEPFFELSTLYVRDSYQCFQTGLNQEGHDSQIEAEEQFKKDIEPILSQDGINKLEPKKIKFKIMYYRYLALIKKILKKEDSAVHWLKTYYKYFEYLSLSQGKKMDIKELFEKLVPDIIGYSENISKAIMKEKKIDLFFNEMVEKQIEFLCQCSDIDDNIKQVFPEINLSKDKIIKRMFYIVWKWSERVESKNIVTKTTLYSLGLVQLITSKYPVYLRIVNLHTDTPIEDKHISIHVTQEDNVFFKCTNGAIKFIESLVFCGIIYEHSKLQEVIEQKGFQKNTISADKKDNLEIEYFNPNFDYDKLPRYQFSSHSTRIMRTVFNTETWFWDFLVARFLSDELHFSRTLNDIDMIVIEYNDLFATLLEKYKNDETDYFRRLFEVKTRNFRFPNMVRKMFNFKKRPSDLELKAFKKQSKNQIDIEQDWYRIWNEEGIIVKVKETDIDSIRMIPSINLVTEFKQNEDLSKLDRNDKFARNDYFYFKKETIKYTAVEKLSESFAVEKVKSSWSEDVQDFSLEGLTIRYSDDSYLCLTQVEKRPEKEAIQTWQNYDKGTDQLWQLDTDGRLHNLRTLTLGSILKISRKGFSHVDKEFKVKIEDSTGIDHERWTSQIPKEIAPAPLEEDNITNQANNHTNPNQQPIKGNSVSPVNESDI